MLISIAMMMVRNATQGKEMPMQLMPTYIHPWVSNSSPKIETIINNKTNLSLVIVPPTFNVLIFEIGF